MSSLNINSLIAGISTQLTGKARSSRFSPDLGTVKNTEPKGDVFERGQWWKNQTVRSGEGSGSDNPLVYTRSSVVKNENSSRVDSEEGSAALLVAKSQKGVVSEEDATSSGESDEATDADGVAAPKKPDGELLGQDDLALLDQLKKADQAVRAHELAHLSAAGGFAKGGASYSFKRGPDGKNYAVGGEVQIDMGQEASPEATIAKMRVVRRAALAPADPSPQDQKVAAQATVQMGEALSQLRLDEPGQKSLERVVETNYKPATDSSDNSHGGDSGDSGPNSPFAGNVAVKNIGRYLQAFSSSSAINQSAVDFLA